MRFYRGSVATTWDGIFVVHAAQPGQVHGQGHQWQPVHMCPAPARSKGLNHEHANQNHNTRLSLIPNDPVSMMLSAW